MADFNTGASSGFSLLSPRGLAWVQRKTGSARLGGILQKLKSPGPLWPKYGLGRWLPNAGLTTHLLPPEEVARQLVMREDMASPVRLLSLTEPRLFQFLQRYLSAF